MRLQAHNHFYGKSFIVGLRLTPHQDRRNWLGKDCKCWQAIHFQTTIVANLQLPSHNHSIAVGYLTRQPQQQGQSNAALVLKSKAKEPRSVHFPILDLYPKPMYQCQCGFFLLVACLPCKANMASAAPQLSHKLSFALSFPHVPPWIPNGCLQMLLELE